MSSSPPAACAGRNRLLRVYDGTMWSIFGGVLTSGGSKAWQCYSLVRLWSQAFAAWSIFGGVLTSGGSKAWQCYSLVRLWSQAFAAFDSKNRYQSHVSQEFLARMRKKKRVSHCICMQSLYSRCWLLDQTRTSKSLAQSANQWQVLRAEQLEVLSNLGRCRYQDVG